MKHRILYFTDKEEWSQNILDVSSIVLNTRIGPRVWFKGERLGWLARGFHKSEIESTDFIETSVSFKSRKVT
jgi:hypothetical protein